MPSRNPLPLSAGQETQVRDLYFARVRALCAAEIKGSSPLLLFLLPSLVCWVNGPAPRRVLVCTLLTLSVSQNSQNAQSAEHSQPPSRVAPNA